MIILIINKDLFGLSWDTFQDFKLFKKPSRLFINIKEISTTLIDNTFVSLQRSFVILCPVYPLKTIALHDFL